jgi:hypothetical protein
MTVVDAVMADAVYADADADEARTIMVRKDNHRRHCPR